MDQRDFVQAPESDAKTEALKARGEEARGDPRVPGLSVGVALMQTFKSRLRGQEMWLSW